jgi:NAD(P)-dependent dehydrogenase (short-subunit alcohol dehydrogenase family)
VFTDLVADNSGSRRVALVAGATRGAGRAIAVELARAGYFVYATGRSSRVSGPSEMDRPETIEETGDLIRAAGGAGTPGFAISESPAYVARGVTVLARSADASRWAGTIVSARQLADAYGITDTDGSKPDCWGYLAAYGWEREDGAGIDDFR